MIYYIEYHNVNIFIKLMVKKIREDTVQLNENVINCLTFNKLQNLKIWF